MKQHITVEQLNELSDKAKLAEEDYREKWYKSDKYKGDQNERWPKELFWNIGIMIEFLDEKNEYEHWWEDLLYPDGKDIFPEYEGELCDALWDLVHANLLI